MQKFQKGRVWLYICDAGGRDGKVISWSCRIPLPGQHCWNQLTLVTDEIKMVYLYLWGISGEVKKTCTI